ncbi:hypothetical protein CWI75_03500 [Kineobactrum sediminis]|uniref:Uncharacterized protein n=1 Tax=Kineobactrum sediminis TaxID=1905677 RepID=A0A2N5Y7N9_9GAMM|nr:MgtC/SapB family protein [Kineobactrum sediminis]PLW84416.1 hypothetical protein CWI75_03500 [Kineobactrum sediminis]
MDYSEVLNHFANLGLALAIGLLIGSERGWHRRNYAEGERVAGIRTFALMALLGALVAASGQHFAPKWAVLASALAFMPLAFLLVVGYVLETRRNGDLSITTPVAAMATFWLGTMPVLGLALPAAASAVVLTLLLHLKGKLHHWLEVLDHQELLGTLQFLLLSVVLLPLLPNREFGPWGSLNPWELWWMVVLISGLSMLGYFAMRIVGPGRGVLVTSLAGGLASSTAVTVSLSRLHRDQLPGATTMISSGILLACSTMYARIAVVVFVINRDLLPATIPAIAAGFLALLGIALWRMFRVRGSRESESPAIKNPLQLLTALQFGLLLAIVMVASEALQQWYGEAGLYVLAVLTGTTDVDAIVLSLAPRAQDSLGTDVAVMSISLAAATNTIMKGVYCRWIAGPGLGNKVLVPTVVTAALVLAFAAITIW